MNCGLYRGVKLWEHCIKIIERVLERRIRALVNFDEAQFGFMPGKGTTDALFLVQRLQEEHRAKDKLMISKRGYHILSKSSTPPNVKN